MQLLDTSIKVVVFPDYRCTPRPELRLTIEHTSPIIFLTAAKFLKVSSQPTIFQSLITPIGMGLMNLNHFSVIWSD